MTTGTNWPVDLKKAGKTRKNVSIERKLSASTKSTSVQSRTNFFGASTTVKAVMNG